MRPLRVLSVALTAGGLLGCDGDGEGSVATEAGRGDGAGADGSSDCTVAYSCRAEMPGGLLSCIESSVRPSAAVDACRERSIAGLSYVYSDAPCPRQPSMSGCLVREGAGCRVVWFYGTVPGNSFAQQCSSQGHEPVSR